MSLRDHCGILAAGAVTCALAAWPAPAQAQSDYDEDRPALVFYAQGGAFSPLAHLDDDNNAEFKSGFVLGGGTAYRLNRFVALRGNFTFARAEARDAGPLSPIAGNKFNRFVYDGDLQLRYPLSDGVTPYVFVGGGGITVQRDVVRNRSAFTKGAGKLGAGLSYQLPDSEVGIYVEGAGWIYKWDRYGFDNVQFDTTLSGGISYRFHF
jgi:outer membrane protein with beta-barrel domain